MKISKLIKSLPILSTVLIIIILCFNNQKENTKLRVLIWDTPSLALGTYLSISTASGFILSYIITTNLGNLYNKKPTNSLKNNKEYQEQKANEYSDEGYQIQSDNILIERDINEPLPTINASFRVIGKNNRNEVVQNNKYQNYEITEESYDSDVSDDLYNNQEINLNYNKEVRKISNDWDDDSYLKW